MKMLNKIEIRGVIGRYSSETIQDKTLHRFTVVTSHACMNTQGESVVETQWFNVSAWEGKNVSIPENAHKGFYAHVKGLLRVRKFINSEGQSDAIAEIIPSKVEIIDPIYDI